jgi:hypothetical protein
VDLYLEVLNSVLELALRFMANRVVSGGALLKNWRCSVTIRTISSLVMASARTAETLLRLSFSFWDGGTFHPKPATHCLFFLSSLPMCHGSERGHGNTQF